MTERPPRPERVPRPESAEGAIHASALEVGSSVPGAARAEDVAKKRDALKSAHSGAPAPAAASASAGSHGGHGHASRLQVWGGRIGFFFADLLPAMIKGLLKGAAETIASESGKGGGGGGHAKSGGGGGHGGGHH